MLKRWSPSRLAGVVALVELGLVVPFVTPVELAGLATGALVLVAGFETLSLREVAAVEELEN